MRPVTAKVCSVDIAGDCSGNWPQHDGVAASVVVVRQDEDSTLAWRIGPALTSG